MHTSDIMKLEGGPDSFPCYSQLQNTLC